ncbi:hypothetical protein D3C78_1130720 [compost metagenome]
MQQIADRHLLLGRLLGQICQGEGRTVDLLDDALGFSEAPLAHQPARRLGRAEAHQQQQHTDDRRTGQDQAPGVGAAAVQNDVADDVGQCSTGKPQDGQHRQARAAVLLGHELHQQRARHGIFEAHPDADQES